MYLEFYNLKTEPFRITPDPEFLYLSPSHREALATIIYAVEQGKGFMALVGEVGLGKTTLLQAFLQERLGVKEKVIYLFNSRFSYAGLLRALARELDLEAAYEEPEALLDRIYQALIREYAQGNTVVLLIDEAQGLPVETLEGLRQISNLETPTDKLLQIVLVGQPELTAKLDRYELRQLKQRIAVQAVLSPLTRKESREYLRFRLEKAGGRAEDIFTPRALEMIVRRARGIPRALNILADNALVTGFGYLRKPISVKVVNEVSADLEGRKKSFFRRWVPASQAALLVGLVVLGVSIYYQQSDSGPKVSIILREKDRADQAAAVKVPLQEDPLPAIGIQSVREGEVMNLAVPKGLALGKTEASRGLETPTPGNQGKEPVATEKKPTPEKENPVIPSKRKVEVAPSPEQQPAAAEEQPAPGFPFTRKVRKGENLYRMILEVYGASNPELWGLVRKRNPRIKEDLKIIVGQKIVFPEWKKMAKKGEG